VHMKLMSHDTKAIGSKVTVCQWQPKK